MKTKFKRKVSSLLLLGMGSVSLASYAQDDGSDYDFDEIVVTAPFNDREAETILPITVLSGEELQEKVANSLGETLKNEIGVNSASFGTGVGQPVIRGQTGRRVMSLSNSVGVLDAAATSPDHMNAVEAILADRIEVVRGPSTLLYGSGAIGGVVNVIDSRIPERLVEETQFVLQQTRNTVNDEDRTVVRLDGSVGNFAFHLDAFTRENDNVEIPGFAIDEMAQERLEDLIADSLGGEHHDDDHENDHDDHDDDHEGEEENTNGFIGNSNAESDGGTLGFSWVGDRGFIGFSANELTSNYGLPPGTHSHAHGEEHHEEDDHDDDLDDEDHDEEEHGHEDVENVRLDMVSRRYDLRGGYEFADGWIESIRGSLGFTDYEHSEIEFFEDGDQEVGTRFSNEGSEGRFTLTHRPMGNWNGVWGFQYQDSEYIAAGEEAYIPRSDISSRALFGVERWNQGSLTAEIGVRLEDNKVDPNGSCEYDGGASSISGSLLYDVGDDSNFVFSLSRSERAPGVEELFSNITTSSCGRPADDEDLVAHAATNLLEVGNPNLDEEVARNFEIGYRLNGGAITAQFNAYLNQIDNYIFLDLTAEEHEETRIAQYLGRDAEFKGFEGEIAVDLFSNDDGVVNLRIFGDLTDAEFVGGGNVPRIPAAKYGAELNYFGNEWSGHVHVTEVQDQGRVGNLELPTDGYTNVSLYADYHFDIGDSELKVFLRGDNLLDEEIRTHNSFLKNFAPEPGRSYILGLRFEY